MEFNLNKVTQNMTMEEKIQRAQIMRQRGFPPIENMPTNLHITEEAIKVSVNDERSVLVYEIKPEIGLKDNCPMFINFHGGGFVKGREVRDKLYCSWLANTFNALVWDVDYALAPENPFPAAVDDAWAVCSWAFLNAEKLNVNINKIILIGHSAGGNLVAGVCLSSFTKGIVKPAAVIMEYFPLDLSSDPVSKLTKEELENEKEVKRSIEARLYNQFYCTDHSPKEELLSPIFAVDEKLSIFPNTLIITAGKDKIRHEDEQFANKLISAGVSVTLQRFENSLHGFTINRSGQWQEALNLQEIFLNANIATQDNC